jgi:CAAX protease family protein
MPQLIVKDVPNGRLRGGDPHERAEGRAMRQYAAQRPITALCVVAIGLTIPLQMALLVAGLNVFPGKLAELLLLTGTATLITSWIGGRAAVRRLFGGLTRWRIGAGRWAMLLLAMPALTIAVAAASGTLHSPDHGWVGQGLTYLALLALILLTASLWEETAWSYFVQRRLMDRRGLLVGSLLTAIPVGLIHLPLAFEGDGWAGTTWTEAFVNWGFLLGALPFFRYLAGVLLVDTRGSVLAVAVLHASFNASGALSVVPDGWQYVPALALLTALIVLHRRLRGHSLSKGTVEDPTSVSERAAARP